VDLAAAVFERAKFAAAALRAVAIPASIAATKMKVETEPADSAAMAGPGQ
jgi:hypothetical protein